MPYYKVRLKHDSGIVTIKTYAKDRDSAIGNVANAEGCPHSAVLSATKVGGAWVNSKLVGYKSLNGSKIPMRDFYST